MYTQGSAWFAFAEKERGSLEVGKLADPAAFTKDHFTVPVEEIGEIEAVMTVVGGVPSTRRTRGSLAEQSCI
jgi:predicted amidohydrolase YtcJ